MNSRLALSALFILIAAMVLASQGTGLLEKFQVLRTSCASTISDVRALPALDHSCTGASQSCAGGTIWLGANTITFNFPDATHCLGSHARYLQRFVLNLIDSDHQGE
jgi:hypothetical protein